MANCRSCGAEIVWLETAKNKRPMICDPAYVQIVTDEGKMVRGRIPHWATCPDAKAWKKPRPGSGS